MRAELTGPRLRETGWFDDRPIGGAIEQHASGRRDHSQLLWSLLMFSSFLRDVHEAPISRLGSAAVGCAC
jgi:asparagine synthase (glutamine-hydrolysing)